MLKAACCLVVETREHRWNVRTSNVQCLTAELSKLFGPPKACSEYTSTCQRLLKQALWRGLQRMRLCFSLHSALLVFIDAQFARWRLLGMVLCFAKEPVSVARDQFKAEGVEVPLCQDPGGAPVVTGSLPCDFRTSQENCQSGRWLYLKNMMQQQLQAVAGILPPDITSSHLCSSTQNACRAAT